MREQPDVTGTLCVEHSARGIVVRHGGEEGHSLTNTSDRGGREPHAWAGRMAGRASVGWVSR